MAETLEQHARPTDPVGRVLYRLARWLALLGSAILCLIALMTAASVFGRATFSAPVPGDVEMTAIGIGLAVFCFLPYCQITRNNIIVDFFMAGASGRAKALCDIVGGVMFLGIGAMLTWRMVFGGLDMYRYGEMSITVGFPRWTTFPLSILCLAFLLVVVCYTIWRNLVELRGADAP
jgi:TRAP-type C4-dicarboxylate transport system permease small subunit